MNNNKLITFLNQVHQKQIMTSFFIETYGSSDNVSDAEQMAGLLAEAKFIPAVSVEEADIVILNPLCVPFYMQGGFHTRLEQIKKDHPHKMLIIAGCIPDKVKKISVVESRQFHHIVEAVEETLNSSVVKMPNEKELPPLDLPKLRKNSIIEVIPITRGCGTSCAWCKTTLKSYPIPEIVTVAQQAISEGVREIWLSSEDAFGYGGDIETSLPLLLQELLQLPGKYKVRLSRGNPVSLTKIQDQLFPLFLHDKMFSYLHLGLGSGSAQLLSTFFPGITPQEYLGSIEKFKENALHGTLAVDLVLGIPTETEEQHWETITLLRSINPDLLYLAPHPKAVAEDPKFTHRSKIIIDVFSNIAKMRHERWLDWEGPVIIDEKTADQWIGHNFAYTPILVQGEFKLGDIVKVRVTKVTSTELQGLVVSS